MNTRMLTRARAMFDRPGIPRHIVRHNCRAWARAVRKLGPKWVFAQPLDFRKEK